MSKVVKSVGKAISKVGKKVGEVAKKAWQNKFVRTALIAAAAVFTAGLAAPMITGAAATSSIGSIFANGATMLYNGAASALGAAGTGLSNAVASVGEGIGATWSAATGAAPAVTTGNAVLAGAPGAASTGSSIGGFLGKALAEKGVGAALAEGGLKLAGGYMADRGEEKARQQERDWQLQDREQQYNNIRGGATATIPSYLTNVRADAAQEAPPPTAPPIAPNYAQTDPTMVANPYGEFALPQQGIYKVAGRA